MDMVMVQIRQDVPLAPHTTFRIGGKARFFADVESEDELLEALGYADTNSLPIFVLGGGSNLLVADGGFAGLVLHLKVTGPLERHASFVEVPAGTDWDALVLDLCRQGSSGMECLAGIPGLVGASPIQNIGAYGQDVSQTIHAVRAYDREQRQFVTLTKEECGFSYRQSIFNTTQPNRYIITRVTFTLDPSAEPDLSYPDLRSHFASAPHEPTPLEVYKAVRAIRQAKGMLLEPDGAPGSEDTRSAGSFFKNPIVPESALQPLAAALGIAESAIPRYPASKGCIKIPAAWLLDRVGFHRGYTDGEAAISSRHTLALINRGRATYADIARLRDRIVQTVEAQLQITLEQEPVELPQA